MPIMNYNMNACICQIIPLHVPRNMQKVLDTCTNGNKGILSKSVQKSTVTYIVHQFHKLFQITMALVCCWY